MDLDDTLTADGIARSSGAASEPSPTTNFGRYRVVHRLGAGGMGVVYAAHDPELDRRVAIKVIRDRGAGETPERRSIARERLAREARVMARVRHPNIAAVHDVGEADGQVYVAMELIEGTTLTGWLAEEKRSWAQLRGPLVAAGRGLAAAHDAGIVHRDFKPDNVLMGMDAVPRVTDFGLARHDAGISAGGSDPALGSSTVTAASASAGSLTKTGSLLGTPAYMSPEQLRGEPSDARSDQFSFAVVLHEAVYGRRPFAADSLEELLDAIRSDRREQVDEAVLRAVPLHVREVIGRGLHPDPSDRFACMDDMLAALSAPPASSSRTRRRILVAAAILALVGLGMAALVVVRRWRGQGAGSAETGHLMLATSGAEPRRVLTSDEIPGGRYELDLVNRIQIDVKVVGKPALGQSAVVTTRTKLAVRVGRAGRGYELRYRVLSAAASASGKSRPGDLSRFYTDGVSRLSGRSGRVGVSSNGITGRLQMDDATVADEALVTVAANDLALFVLATPPRAVGVGATWKVQKKRRDSSYSGITWQRYELRAHSDSETHVTMSFDETADVGNQTEDTGAKGSHSLHYDGDGLLRHGTGHVALDSSTTVDGVRATLRYTIDLTTTARPVEP